MESKFHINISTETGIRKKLGIKENEIVFLYLARFAEGNGWKELIAYANELIKSRPECQFILAGADSTINKKKYETSNIHILSFQKDIKKQISDKADEEKAKSREMWN